MLSPSYPQRAPWGTADKLRAWQQEALDHYFSAEHRDYLVAATPGAGKTTFALTLAAELLRRRTVRQIVVVAPTEHLKNQWADAAARLQIRLDPRFQNRQIEPASQFHGVVVTYAQVAAASWVHRSLSDKTSTLVILDEVHHGGDALSWGDSLREAYSRATRRLLLSGTPFRSDTAPIPFVEYHPDSTGARVSRTDYSYGYARALEDGVVRPVLFHLYAGTMRWRTSAGEEYEAQLGHDDTQDVISQAWRTALDPTGEWMPAVLAAADRRLTEIRQHIPDAGGLVIATDQLTARAYAKLIRTITGEAPTVVLSDEPAASAKIDRFSQDNSRWMVAVRMVSEGVDVPRLAVGVYATSASTPLFFAQAIGRFVRARRRGEAASIFLPTVPNLMKLAHELEKQRDHALDRTSSNDDTLDDHLLEQAERGDSASDELTAEFAFEALGSSAHFDRVLFDGAEFGEWAQPGSEEEHEFIGLPGLLEPEHVHSLLMQRQSRQQRLREAREAAASATGQAPTLTATAPELPTALHRSLKEQRQLLNSLVSVYAGQSNQPHGAIHAEIRRLCGGPAVSTATVAQIQNRIDLLRKRMRS